MSRTHNRRGFRGVIATAGLALVAAPLTLVPSSAQAADPVVLNLLNINDFHGRIDSNTVAFAATVEKLRAEGGAANTLFLSAGDNIGASVFASASADDKPTLDVLNALDMRTSAVGNHEFDQGYDDLITDVDTMADFSYLGANVYLKGTTTPALDEFDVFDVAGLTVGVVGAVTEETPTLVTPAGVEKLDFGDPVEAVNRVAGQLSDGNAANGEADIIIAEYHEGATGSGLLADELADKAAFADIVTDTSGDVDAIFNGHTHQPYAYSAVKPGGGTRPIVQTGSYGGNVGQVQLTIDPATEQVTSHTETVVKRLAPTDSNANGKTDPDEQAAFNAMLADLVAANPTLQEVKAITDAAIAAAAGPGGVPVGKVTRDITTAYKAGAFTDGVFTTPDPKDPLARDDRRSESTLGNLVANVLRDELSPDRLGGAEIGVVNPGGLRAELFYAGSTADDADVNSDGVITFAEANAVLPFVNNLWTTSLTGVKVKEMLEQQWQTKLDGTDLGTYAHLGLSDNVSVTRDPSRPLGDRVTSVLVDGVPLDPAASYRIATFSFLAGGGDNFHAFRSGTNVKDTGLIDRDVWIQYLRDNGPLLPSFERRQVDESGIPAAVVAGQAVSFTLGKLNLTSLGSPQNTRVAVSLRPADGTGESVFVGSFPVTGDPGAATVEFTAPAGLTEPHTVTAIARPSKTRVGLPVLRASSTVQARTVHASVPAGIRNAVVATVDAGGFETDGAVKVLYGGRVIGEGTVAAGRARMRVDAFPTAGLKTVRVRYLGGSEAKGSATSLTLRVVRATPVMGAVVRPDVIRARTTEPRVVTRLRAPGLTVRGTVTAIRGGRVLDEARLSDGRAVLDLPTFAAAGSKRVVLRYTGSAATWPVTKVIYLRVQR